MNIRRRKGATLGLVALCVLILAIIGFGFYFISKIMGGGREVANATDAGILNTAKRSLLMPAVSINSQYPDFDGLGVDNNGSPNGSNQVNLLNYNRAVGQTLIVQLNAMAEGTTDARNNSNTLVSELDKLGLALRDALTDTQVMTVNGYFADLASSNNVKMMGPGSRVDLDGNIVAAYVKPGGAGKTNVYFNSSVFPANMVNGIVDNSGIKSASGQPYVKGYVPLTLGSGFTPAMGAVVLPQNRPHLISTGEFNNSTNPIGSAPPNSFRANSQSRESKSGALGGATAAAIVGVLSTDYEASIPRGYLRIKNFGDSISENAGAPPIPVGVDSGDSIFNNELNLQSGGGISQANNGAFSTNTSRLSRWVAYNTSTGSDRDGKDPNKDPLGPNRTPNMPLSNRPDPDIRFGCSNGQIATVAELKTITSVSPRCDNTMYMEPPMGTTPSYCDNPNLSCWIQNYGRTVSFPSPGTMSDLTNLEYMKGTVIKNFQQGVRCFNMQAPQKPSGMKKFDKNLAYRSPGMHPINFGSVATPWDLLQQAGGCSVDFTNGIAAQILQRCREIRSQTTANEVQALLSSQPLPVGGELYIFMPSPGQPLTIQATPPGWVTSRLPPDGTTSPPGGCTSGSVNVRNIQVNTEFSKPGAGGKGDCDLHDQPYDGFQVNPALGDLRSSDIAEWQPSSGFRNLLGEVSFKNQTEGGGQFCKPN